MDITVYQFTKLRMLELYYTFLDKVILDKLIDKKDFGLLQVDTDIIYTPNFLAVSDNR